MTVIQENVESYERTNESCLKNKSTICIDCYSRKRLDFRFLSRFITFTKHLLTQLQACTAFTTDWCKPNKWVSLPNERQCPVTLRPGEDSKSARVLGRNVHTCVCSSTKHGITPELSRTYLLEFTIHWIPAAYNVSRELGSRLLTRPRCVLRATLSSSVTGLPLHVQASIAPPMNITSHAPLGTSPGAATRQSMRTRLASPTHRRPCRGEAWTDHNRKCSRGYGRMGVEHGQ